MTNSPYSERETGGLCADYAADLIDFLRLLPVSGNIVFRTEVRPRGWVIDRIIAQIERFAVSGPEASSTIRAQAQEIERLTAGLAKANEGFEEYERRFYLEQDAREAQAAELERLRGALEPFAAYSQQMDAYAILHRGKHLPDDKVLAYSQTEMGTSAALVIGHFRDADAAFAGKAKGWTGFYRSKIRASRPNTSEQST